ncbi:MAG: hypothetical protein QW265_00740 [Candidatus Bathyarchaeia archaeon]
MKVQIDEEIERRFRELAMKKFGFGKGSLSEAAQEALLRWISEVEKEFVEFEGDPIEAIDGLLADVKIDSLKLQHKAKKFWSLGSFASNRY